MPRVNFVKKARKAKPSAGIQVGDSYYWWGQMVGSRGVRRYSKTRPTRSQLTQSEFLSAIYDLEDNFDTNGAATPEDLQELRDNVVSELRALGEEQTSKKDNMPENLQYSSTADTLEARAEACDQIADEFDNVELDYDEPSDEELQEEALEELGLDDEEELSPEQLVEVKEMEAELRERKLAEWLVEKAQELEDVSWDYE